MQSSQAFITENMIIDSDVFPWGVHVGELIHPRSGVSFPAVLPSKAGGILIHHNEKMLAGCIENLCVHFFDSIFSTNKVEIKILDFSLENKFPNLKKLSFDKNQKLFSDTKQSYVFLEEIRNTAKVRSHEFLQSSSDNIQKYNKTARVKEAYILCLVNLDHFPLDLKSLYDLLEVLKSAYKLGFFFVFYSNQSYLTTRLASIKSDDERLVVDSILGQIKSDLPIVNITKPDVSFNQHPENEDIVNIIKSNRLKCQVSDQKNFNTTYHRVVEIIKSLQEQSPSDIINIPIGFSADGRTPINFILGKNNQCYHTFIIGMNGTGKTTLLDHIIMGIASRYKPSEVSLELFDYKEGVEFQKYRNLPHVKTLMLDNTDYKCIFARLKEFEKLIAVRGKLFRQHSVIDIDEYNGLENITKIPRCFLIIDEVQKLLVGNLEVNNLLNDLSKRCRAFGMYLIFSTQTLSNYNIPAEMMTQFRMRIAFQVDTNDCMKFFSINNDAASKLRRYHCIINENLGHVENNIMCMVNPPVKKIEIENIIALYPNEKNEQFIIDANFDDLDLTQSETHDQSLAASDQQAESDSQSANSLSNFNLDEIKNKTPKLPKNASAEDLERFLSGED
jgi:hypothetical protein